jgi:hypothetical protein
MFLSILGRAGTGSLGPIANRRLIRTGRRNRPPRSAAKHAGGLGTIVMVAGPGRTRWALLCESAVQGFCCPGAWLRNRC